MLFTLSKMLKGSRVFGGFTKEKFYSIFHMRKKLPNHFLRFIHGKVITGITVINDNNTFILPQMVPFRYVCNSCK